MNITVGSSEIVGIISTDVGVDASLSVGVTLDSPTVTGTFRRQWVGMSGFKINLAGVEYTVASVESVSSLTLTSNYLATSGTVAGIWRRYAVLRVYVVTPFVPSGESYVAQSGTPGSSVWFRRYAVPIINDGTQDVAFFPEIILPATTDSSVPTARYFAGVYGQSGSLIQSFPGCVDTFRLDASTTPTSWAQICQFNSPAIPAPSQPIDYVTQQELDARLPSGSANQLLYFKSTGNVLTPLSLSADFSITADTLSLSAAHGVDRIQEEGSNLPQQRTLNFVGSSFTAADDPGNSRTNLTADSDLNAIASNSTNGIYARTGSGTVAARTITQPAAGITVSNGDGVAGNPTLALANDLAGLEGLSSTGGAYRTATDTWANRSLTQPAAGLTITNPAGVAGNPTFALANDLAAVEGLATNGLATRTTTDTWTTRTITGTANEITSTNGDGVSGNPTLSLPSALTFTGKTVTNGTFVTPRVQTSILDTAGNELIDFTATPSAANEITLANATTGNGPTLSTAGGDADINLNINAKGSGVAVFGAIPTLPASNPTTSNQATRKAYVDGKRIYNQIEFFIVDPSATTTSAFVLPFWLPPSGLTANKGLTRMTVIYGTGSHAAGGSVTFTLFVTGSSSGNSISLNDTNNTPLTIYTNDFTDVTSFSSVTIQVTARSGTVSERNVTILIEWYQELN